jgi:hypothetical protein
MLSKRPWTLPTLKPNFQVQLPTNLESFKSTTPLPMLLSTVEWNHMETLIPMELALGQLRSTKRLNWTYHLTKVAYKIIKCVFVN